MVSRRSLTRAAVCYVAVCWWGPAVLVLATPARAATDSGALRISARVEPRQVSGPKPAAPGPRLVTVAGDTVRVRDLLCVGGQDAGSSPQGLTGEELGRVALTCLRPGERRTLTREELAAALAQAGIDPAARGLTLPAVVVVERAAQVISAESLAKAGADAIRRQLALRPGEEAEVMVITPPRAMLAPLGPLRLDATVRPPALRGGLWAAEIAGRVSVSPNEEETAFTCALRYRVRVMGAALVTRRFLRKHETIAPADVVVERRELSSLPGVPLSSPAELAGRRAARAVSAGTVITSDWLEGMPAVARGELILAVAQVGSIRASARLTAGADGRVGEVVPARGADGDSQVLVLVTGPGEGEVAVVP